MPVRSNGDVKTVDDAAEMLKCSGADGVMIGRGTYGGPWLPSQVAHFLETGERLADPSLEELMNIILRHYDAMQSHYGKELGIRNMRKHIAWYSKGLPGSAEFRASVFTCVDEHTVVGYVRAFFEPLIERGYSPDAKNPDAKNKAA